MIASVEIDSGLCDPDHTPFAGGLSSESWIYSLPCAEFNDTSFSRSRDMVGAHQNLNGSCDLTTPFQG